MQISRLNINKYAYTSNYNKSRPVLKSNLLNDSYVFNHTLQVKEKKAHSLYFGSIKTLKRKLENVFESKEKQKIMSLYDTIFQNMKDEFSEANFEFIKPELVFRHLNDASGLYFKEKNQIVFDIKNKKRFIPKNLKLELKEKIDDDLEIVYDFTKKKRKNSKKTDNEENYVIAGAILAHELTHAAQFQYFLNSQTGEKYAKMEGINYIPYNKIRKTIGLIPDNTKVKEYLPDGSYMEYGIRDIYTDFINCSDEDAEYYTNLAEISAMNGEAKYWQDLLDGKLPCPSGISRELLKYFYKVNRKNVVLLSDITGLRTLEKKVV